jgi:hypothetical protein
MSELTPEDTQALRARLGATDTSELAAAAPSSDRSPAVMTVAILWAATALIFGIVILVNAKDETYGADAYTGIQNAINWAVRGIAFLLFGSGALGLVIATRGDRR